MSPPLVDSYYTTYKYHIIPVNITSQHKIVANNGKLR
jgi:hypothetical protein